MIKTEGIILDILNFQDFHQILTVFSESLGLIKIFSNYARTKKKEILSKGMTCEFAFEKTRGDLYQLRETTVIQTFPRLRLKYETLHSALQCLEAIKKSQVEEKPSPPLYQLLKSVLLYLPDVLDPKVLTAAFYLKILLHEGLISFHSEKLLNPPFPLSLEQHKEIYALTFTRSIALISNFTFKESLLQAEKLFCVTLEKA